jgi:hypothetical protein
MVVLIGVTIMVGGAVADGHLFGDVLAFGMHGDHDVDHPPASRDADVTPCVSLRAVVSARVWPQSERREHHIIFAGDRRLWPRHTASLP